MENGAARVKAGCGAKGGKAIARLMSGKDQERERRLAEALRENLRKRKAQARGEEPVARPPEPSEPSAPPRSRP